MKYQVLRGFCLGGGIDVHPGDPIELTERAAELYIRQGRIKPVTAGTITGPELMAKASLLATIALAESTKSLNELVSPDETDPEIITAYQLRALELEEEEVNNG